MASTFSPDPNHLGPGAGTSAQQSAQPPQRADTANGGWDSKAAGATMGNPGNWTPAGSAAPYTLADCEGVTATPATAWTTGTHVLLDDGTTHVYWNGTAWTAGDGTAAATTKGKGEGQTPDQQPQPNEQPQQQPEQ